MAVAHQTEDVIEHGILQQLFLLRDDALAEQILQPAQLAAGKQFVVAANLRQQRLLGRQRQHVGVGQAELAGDRFLHPLDLDLDEIVAGEVVPQHVDLVQHCVQTGLAVIAQAPHVVLPHRHVGGGDAGVGGQQEEDRLGVGQHRQGQFRLAAEGIQAGGVEDAQALAQQGVIEVDQRVTPGRHLHHVRLAGALQLVREEAELDRLLDRQDLGCRHLAERQRHVGRVGGVEGDVHPVSG
ncbi:hypothetical protein D3C81_1194630 [compost metagenome]